MIAIPLETESQQAVVDQFRHSGQTVLTFFARSRFSLRVVQDLCQLIRDNRIDIIHTHGYKSDILGVLAAKITGIKAVTTPHGYGEPRDRF